MSKATYRVTFNTNISIDVLLDDDDPDLAADRAWPIAEAYLHTLGTQTGDERIVSVDASLDGVGADEVVEATS
jgi:hypothetical protein